MKYLRYKGEFVSRLGVIWRTEIFQESTSAFKVNELIFESNPLIIEWKHEDKENVICGSLATLNINSPNDRMYEDLYSIEVGNIILNVYQNNNLYWSGALDPEFYEEPYERLRNYAVTLTFSDFGILDRIKYDLNGIKTLHEIVLYAIEKSSINILGVDNTYISTTFTDGSTISNGGISVRSDNFIDEDGELCSLKEVIEGILQPLALKMIQREGKVFIYDLNALYKLGTSKEIKWDGDTQTMGVDKVCNNIKISFSPYSSSKLMSDDIIEYKDKYDVNHINLASESPIKDADSYGEYYSYYPDYSDEHKVGSNWDYNLVDFTIFLSDNASGLAQLSKGKYFHILPVTGGGSECTGVAYAFRTGGHGGISSGWPKWKINNSVPRPNKTTIFKTNKVYIPALDSDSISKYKIRLSEEILIDARYNPFSGSSKSNDEGNDNTLKARSAFVFIPVKVTLYDKDSNALYHYSNIEIARNAAVGHLGYMKGKWVEGADTNGDCYLEYYNLNDLRENTGIRGWNKNRHCIGRPDGKGGRMGTTIYDSFAKMDYGEYIPYPPVAGYIEIEIQAGIYGYDYGQKIDNCDFGSENSQWDVSKIYSILRWNLYKAPKVDIVNNNLVFNDAELEDIEYSGYVNPYAKDEISLDTICGTSTISCPAAKGIYYKTDTGYQLQKLVRNNYEQHPEKLLIGTLYSQYATRKTTLSGETLISGGLNYYIEANQGDKRFLLMSDFQELITDCTNAEYCEFRPDEYNDD